MPRFKVEEPQVIAREVFHAAGFPEGEAEIIANVISKANLPVWDYYHFFWFRYDWGLHPIWEDYV